MEVYITRELGKIYIVPRLPVKIVALLKIDHEIKKKVVVMMVEMVL